MASNDSNNITNKSLKIIQINVNSIIRISRRYELQSFLDEHKPDIVLLNETKLNPKHRVHFNNYKTLRKDRIGSIRGGGTAVLIKNNIKHNYYSNNVTNSLLHLESCIIKIPLRGNKNIFVISAYYPAGNNNCNIKSDLFKLFDSIGLQDENNYYILAGDLNSKHTNWGNSTNNSKGISLQNWLSEFEIDFRCKLYASTLPSYSRCGSYLDICISDCRLNIITQNDTPNCLNTIDYDSDHNALEIIAILNNEREIFDFFTDDPIPKYNYKKANWKKFECNIISNINNAPKIPNNRNLTNTEIDCKLINLSSIIIECIEKYIPKFKEPNFYSKITNTIIKRLKSEKSKLLTHIKKHNRLQHTLPEATVKIIKSKIKLIRKLLDENFTLLINKFFLNKLSHLNPTNSSNMFTEIKRTFKKSKQLNLQYIQLPENHEQILTRAGVIPTSMERNDSNNFIIRNEIQILDTIGAYFESFYSHKEINNDNITHTSASNYFNDFLELKSNFETSRSHIIDFSDQILANDLSVIQKGDIFVSVDELVYIFQHLRGKLSSGIDTIPNLVLKKLPKAIISEYCTLFNNMLNNAHFPHIWKTAKVVLLPKKDKNPEDPKNIRPISLLPNISKIFEICINNVINRVCEEKHIINEKQFGFKFKHSTINAIHVLTSSINWNWNKGYCTGACLIDMEKAFDSVWLKGLIFKLKIHNFPTWLIIMIYNMVSNRQFFISHNNENSSKTYALLNGLQQGTVTSPTLFNIYLHDLLDKIENIIAFADDIVIYHADNKITNINSSLQGQFDLVEEYTINWMLQINIEKCESILFRPPVGKCNSDIRKHWKLFGIKSKLCNLNISNTKVVKYLGVYLDNFLYYNSHVKKIIEKATKAYFLYKSLFHCEYLSSRVKIIMYQSLIRPIITYACPIWFNISPSFMEKLRVFERKCLRTCTSLYRTPQSDYKKYIDNKMLYTKANITRIDNCIIQLIRNHIIRCTLCEDNNLIKAPYFALDNYILNTVTKGYVPPESFIFLDKQKYMQNENGIPVFYHIYRRATDKSIQFHSLNSITKRFNTSVSDKDILLATKSTKFWWLS